MLTATFIVQLLKVAPPNTPSVAVAMEFWPLGAAETTLLFIFVATTLRRQPVSSAQTQFLYTLWRKHVDLLVFEPDLQKSSVYLAIKSQTCDVGRP